MGTHLLSAKVLMGRAIESLILGKKIRHLGIMLLEGVPMLLELEVHWALINTALVVLKQVLVLLELSLTGLLNMRGKLRNYCQSGINSWQFIWIHILQKRTFLCPVDF